jgi:hypothetical protein
MTRARPLRSRNDSIKNRRERLERTAWTVMTLNVIARTSAKPPPAIGIRHQPRDRMQEIFRTPDDLSHFVALDDAIGIDSCYARHSIGPRLQ